MDINKTIDQISTIHAHLARTETYHGFHSYPFALSGLSALIAIWIQPHLLHNVPGGRPFVRFWVALALLNILMFGVIMLYRYYYKESNYDRRRTLFLLGQSSPSIGAGIVITAIIYLKGDSFIIFLPGLWAILYSLGIFSTRLMLPHGSGWIALFYFICGTIMLISAPAGPVFSPLGMGLTFGLGQIASAVILYWNRERSHRVGI